MMPPFPTLRVYVPRSYLRFNTSDACAGLVLVGQIVACLSQLVLPKSRYRHVANAEQLRD
jgi:hypothetical protein